MHRQHAELTSVSIGIKWFAIRLMDRLNSLFARFTPSTEVYFSGHLCENAPLKGDGGHLHFLNAGDMRLYLSAGKTVDIKEPAVIFLPRSIDHVIQPGAIGSDLVCAHVKLGHGAQNTLFGSMPDMLVVPISKAPSLASVMPLLFNETSRQQAGMQVALNSLVRYLFVLLLRHLIDSEETQLGLMAALADARLSKALKAIHDYPDQPWTLETLANEALMSRARFAKRFKDTVGCPALDYLTDCRLGVAQSLLLQGRHMKSIASAVGYRSPAALTRVFSRRLGQTPTDWIASQTNGNAKQA